MTYKEALESVANSWASAANQNMALLNAAPSKPAAANTGTTGITVTKTDNPPAPQQASQRLPGTILRLSIPEGTAVNFLNLFEVASPRGAYFVLRLPMLGGLTGDKSMSSLLPLMMNAFKAAGATIEFLS